MTDITEQQFEEFFGVSPDNSDKVGGCLSRITGAVWSKHLPSVLSLLESSHLNAVRQVRVPVFQSGVTNLNTPVRPDPIRGEK